MSDWREGLLATAPSVRLERELRYRVVAPLLRDAAAWCDVAGDEAAAAVLTAEERPAEVLTAGVDDVHAVVTGAKADGADVVVTCLTALDELETSAKLVDALCELATKHGATVVLAAPAPAPPEPEGALDELRRLLPKGYAELHQAPLAGSVIAPAGENAALPAVGAATTPAARPTHVLFAFGPGAAKLAPVAVVEPADLGAERARQRGLEADAALVTALRAELAAGRGTP